MITISRFTGTSYIELMNVSYGEIDRIFDAFQWIRELEVQAHRDAAREAEEKARRNG